MASRPCFLHWEQPEGPGLCSLPAPCLTHSPQEGGGKVGTQELEPPWCVWPLQCPRGGLACFLPAVQATGPPPHLPPPESGKGIPPSGPKWGCDLGAYFWKRTKLEPGEGTGCGAEPLRKAELVED